MIKRYKRHEDNRKFYRVNERIYALSLRVLDAEGKQIGVLSKFEALEAARSQGLDLVEVAPMAKPPVAKIVDYKKFLYQEEKKKREEKKKTKVSETKEVRLGPFMSENDLGVMERRAREFLTNGDKVRLVVFFSGRQITHPEFGHKVLDKTIADLSDISKVEREKRLEGRKLIVLVSPDKKGSGKAAKSSNENQNEQEENKEISV
ncbi:MAG TPA: translation initiation factor IF-3 [Patescibacteria group bacterium]|nr:translation initiation factor IF-3 [Patescibacteria group bacterium]